MKNIHPNAKYKDSLFTFLFRDPDVLRELYSALKGITLSPAGLPKGSPLLPHTGASSGALAVPPFSSDTA